ncbi:hypothetical protein [Streptomyces avicenniae]|uniref:hypothetical protein n=1 Tax=Streptomyces avicenniae TaxID=500153 RepID=UPI00069C17A5|nr:hypothetical protein [Streptomyces avicenniae]
MSAGSATAVFLAALMTVLLVPMAASAGAEERVPGEERESAAPERRHADRPVSRWGQPLSPPALPGPVREEPAEPSGGQAVAARQGGGEMPPVLPLGTGLACLGLGLGILGLRLRQE